MDKKIKKFVGDDAITSYYQHYKGLDRIVEQNKLSNVKESPYTALLQKSNQEKLMPSKLGIIKQRGDVNQIQCNNYKFGDKYIKVMSEAVGRIPNLSIFNLAGNRITENGAQYLITQIMKSGKIIDIKNNSIGKLGSQHLSQCLANKDCWLEELNIEDNKLGDQNVILILENLLDNNTLRILNISKNFLTNAIGDKVQELLEENRELCELYIHWNQVKGMGGMKIFEGLKKNQTLKVLDLSWNSMGQDKDSEECIRAMSESFAENKELLHLDLSNNSFNWQESKSISEGLAPNQTIYGFHFEGNQGYVDNHGFLVVEEGWVSSNMGQNSVSHRIEGVDSVYTNKRVMGEQLQNQCWLCGGWNQIEFMWKLGESGIAQNRPVFIHMDFEGYTGRYTGKCKRISKKFLYKRMVPPGKLMFLFTGDDIQQAAKNYTIVQGQEQRIEDVSMMDRYRLDLEGCQKRNVMQLRINKFLIEKEEYEIKIQIKPRTPEQIYIPPNDKIVKKQWEFKHSIMFAWKPDTQDMLDKCLEFDWSCGRAYKVLKIEEENLKVKERFRSIYRKYKDCYKYFSSLNPIGDIWSVSNFAFNDLIDQSQIIDKNVLQAADVDIKFIATANNLEYKSNPRNPVRGLVRFELMECLIRIADEKYMKKGAAVTDNYVDAVEMMLTEHFNPILDSYDSQAWRDKTYWNEDCDEVFKTYKKILEEVYKKFSVKKVKPGQKSFMCLDEVNDICKMANLYDENFVERDAFIAFNLSMMTQVDELNNDRIFQMQFVEFLEAVARIAEKQSPQPITTHHPEGMSYEQRHALPLHLKTEAICVIFVKCLVDVNMRDIWIKKHSFRSLFELKAKEAEDSDDFEDD